jgi:hypothetical protein
MKAVAKSILESEVRMLAISQAVCVVPQEVTTYRVSGR